ncbi:MAG: AAC(3) family N-acetyltransferase [Casimicrobiaceae bacterium]
MAASWLKAGKARVKSELKRWRHRYARTFRSFTPADLQQCLGRLGVQHGDTLLVHSAYDAFAGFTGKPSDVVAVLQAAVGEDGILLMPTMSFTGTAIDYVRTGAAFDVARTPSRMGLLSELFRRMPGVQRSVHPTHAVAAWGRGAAEIVAGHHAAATPCGAGSPFARLHERHGKILLLGADVDSLTFYHTVEEMLEARFPSSPFTREVFDLTAKGVGGELLATRTRLFDPAVSRRRNLGRLASALRRGRTLREVKLGQLEIALMSTDDVVAAVTALADQGIYCYD